ncbi:MAG: isocitrate lyase [Chloroflexi bacterium]|nr:isocitrate lyase [Chloroflexota bacterium]
MANTNGTNGTNGHNPALSQEILELEQKWANPRYAGIKRDYSAEDVVKLRGSIRIEHTLAKVGAQRLWETLNKSAYVNTFGALTGAQAVQMVAAGLKAIYVSGWQVAADANLAGQTYPDQSLYPSSSAPALVRRINNALVRRDQVDAVDGNHSKDWFAPIVADAEAGFGGAIHAFELMKSMIESGAAGVHFEDQLASEKKCGHMGGKVVVPTSQFIRTLKAARLAADVMGTDTLLFARTDSLAAKLMTSDVDERDRPFMTGKRTEEGHYEVTGGMESSVARGLAYAPYADAIWCETSVPDLDEAWQFARGIHDKYPGKMLAYNCSPSFNWKKKMSDREIAGFQQKLGEMGYKFQFITLAGWHMANLNAFELADAYREEGMTAYVRIQEQEFARQKDGYTAVKHQQEVGAGFFDQVLLTATGSTDTAALAGSTEAEQFSH